MHRQAYYSWQEYQLGVIHADTSGAGVRSSTCSRTGNGLVVKPARSFVDPPQALCIVRKVSRCIEMPVTPLTFDQLLHCYRKSVRTRTWRRVQFLAKTI